MKHDRRQALKLAGAALAASPLMGSPALNTVRVGFVGIGVKGSQHVRNLLHIDGVELRAVCDILEEPCKKAQSWAKRLGKPEPEAYTRGERDFERLCERDDLDLVYTVTPWRWHAPILLAAMRAGKHAASEIPAAVTLDECWELVETSEKAGRHCMMMENVNYRRDEMTILNMVRKGLLGDLLFGEAGYMHDTRYLKIRDYGDGLWLGDHHAQRNGNLYPTHGLGPMAWYMDINRGDRFDYLVSMSSEARGMNLYAEEHLPEGHPKRTRKYINGDVNSSLIRTVNGRMIVLHHDTDLPRPYSRTNLVQGTRGIVRGFPEFLVSLEGDTHQHRWRPGKDLYTEHEHPLWVETRGRAEATPVAKDGFELAKEIRSGDYLEDFRMIEALRKGRPPDYDVYDAAAWSAVSPLTESSVANRSRPVDFPDFTRGKWKTTPPLEIAGV